MENKSLIRILYVDDVQDNRDYFQFLLSDDKHQVEVAESAKQAIQMLLEDAFDVLITGVDMPVLNGYDLAKAVRSRGFDFPIIALAGETGVLDQNAINDYQINAFIQRPVNDARILLDINKAFKDFVNSSLM